MTANIVVGDIAYYPAAAGDITTDAPFTYDMRDPTTRSDVGSEIHATQIHDARGEDSLNLETAGFQLINHPTEVTDFADHETVTTRYYDECKQLAKDLTGAKLAYTYDHLIREPGRQISGGGVDGQPQVTGTDAGGGYIGFAHMDYTDNTTWDAYLAVHDIEPPKNVRRTIALNFWRGLSEVVDDFPLAVCDARTVAPKHLFESVVFGYGASNYSWHNIGIETFSVKHSDAQRWYYYSNMTPDEVLVFKSYDSEGVIGNACPHGAFKNPAARPDTPQRRSVELRVLCFIT